MLDFFGLVEQLQPHWRAGWRQPPEVSPKEVSISSFSLIVFLQPEGLGLLSPGQRPGESAEGVRQPEGLR
jgi:hypothetical protein